MIVTLDGERLDRIFPASDSLQTLIDEVRRAYLGDRMVVSVAFDGRQLLDQELSDKLGKQLERVTRVDLTSADRYELVSAALHEVARDLDKSAAEQAAVADKLSAGVMSEAVSAFGEFLQVWQTCQKAIGECSGLLGEDLTRMRSSDKSVRDHLDVLADKLRELRDAFEAQDTVLLSDLFQYEMPDTCRAWRDILNEMADAIAKQRATTAT